MKFQQLWCGVRVQEDRKERTKSYATLVIESVEESFKGVKRFRVEEE